MQLKVHGQLCHGVVASSKGRLNGCVAVVGLNFYVVLKRQWRWPALGVRNLKSGSPGARALWVLLGRSAHFVDEFLVTLAECDNGRPDPNFLPDVAP